MSDDQTNTQLIIVSAIITNNLGQLLLLKRKSDVKRAPNKYELPSGKVGYGEDPKQALNRIVQQQTNLSGRVGKLLGSKSVISKTQNKHLIIFYNVFEIDHDITENAKIKSEQHIEMVWSRVDKLQQSEVEKNLRSMLSNINAYLLNSTAISHRNDEITTTGDLTIYSDGGSRGNPGPSASGFVIMNEDHEVLEEGGEYLGITTNNQAEYHGVRLGLEAAKKYYPKNVTFRLDSLLVVNQMNGKFQIKNKDLWPIHENIKRLVAEIGNVEFSHVPREENELADAKVNEVLDSRKED